jgi:phytoene dehydrogenase-like protein
MSPLNKETYDTVIIGAGISGLVCGCYLAKAGMKVLIVEQHDKPGGYCTSFKRKGFTFDAAAHTLGSYREGGDFRKRMIELGIDNMIKITRINPSDIIVTPRFSIAISNVTQDFIDQLINLFPHEKNNINRYFAYYNNQSSASQLESVKLRGKSFDSFLRSYFTDEMLINAIAYPIFGYGGVPPSLMQAFTGSKIFNEYILDGGYYPEGGMQNIPNALGQVIRNNKGMILYKSRVENILCKENEITGVRLDNNQSYTSKYVVSACDITQTMKSLLGRELVSNQLIDKLEYMIPSISTFILYMGIDKPFKELPHPGTNIWFLPDYALDVIFNNVNRDDFDDFGAYGYVVRVSPDHKTILAFCLTSFKSAGFWKQNKKKIAETLLNQIERLIPNLKKHIVYFDAATPYTMYRFTLNYKGANYGWSSIQSQLFDPDFSQKSFIKGLYLTGHWTTRAHGIPGVANLGYTTAKLILKREQNGHHVS